jgi:hypothetical protein
MHSSPTNKILPTELKVTYAQVNKQNSYALKNKDQTSDAYDLKEI